MKKFVILNGALFLFCGLAAGSAFAGDQEDIQGTWTLESVSLDGKALPLAHVVYVFTGESLVVRSDAGKEERITFKLETTSQPRIMIAQRDQPASGAKPDRTPYELAGDTLKIAAVAPGDHPTDVSDSGQVLLTLKRKKL